MVNLVFLNDSWPDQWVADPNCGEATAMPRFVFALRPSIFARNLSNARKLAWATVLSNGFVYQNFGKAIQKSGIPCGNDGFDWPHDTDFIVRAAWIGSVPGAVATGLRLVMRDQPGRYRSRYRPDPTGHSVAGKAVTRGRLRKTCERARD